MKHIFPKLLIFAVTLAFVAQANIAFSMTGGSPGETDGFSPDEPFKIYTFSTSGKPSINATLVQSDVIIKSHDSDQVRIEMHVRRGMRILSGEPEEIRHVIEQRENDVIMIRVQPQRPGVFSSDASVRLVIHAPVSSVAQLNITSGNLQFEGFEGSNRIQLTSGNVTMANISGQTQIHLTAGTLNVANYRGVLMGLVRGGSVNLQNMDGESRLQITGGSLAVNNLSGSGIAEVVGGNISAGINGISDALIFNAVGGNISVDIANKVAFDLNAKGNNVEVGKGANWIRGVDDRSEEALYNLREILTGHIGSGEMVLKVNGGGSPLQLNSVSGSVKVTIK